jgi:hypothetical protein
MSFERSLLRQFKSWKFWLSVVALSIATTNNILKMRNKYIIFHILSIIYHMSRICGIQ